LSPARRLTESGIRRAVAPPDAERPPPAPPADLDADLLARWRWQLGATARKAAAARARAGTAMSAWERLAADAAAAGIPGRLVVAAAADAGLDMPAGE
jgi:hypothetical protein